tara:strand:- start:2216 stop:2608 length:393 start_codon:yes stop_codon:yes gene_type:complete
MKYKTIFEAARTKLRAEALAHLATIEVMLHSPESVEADLIVDKIVEAAKLLAMHEGALITINQYFEPKQAPQAPPPAQPAVIPRTPTPDPGPPIRVTEENSPTYKRAVQKEKIKAAAKKRAPKTTKKKTE